MLLKDCFFWTKVGGRNNSVCRECRKIHLKLYRQQNKDKISVSRKKLYNKNREIERSKSRLLATTLTGRFRSGKSSAKSVGREWTITKEQHADLLSNPCFYCKKPLNPTGSGLDRKDNSIDYHYFNVVPCCKRCNSSKGEWFTHKQFLVMMTALLESEIYGLEDKK